MSSFIPGFKKIDNNRVLSKSYAAPSRSDLSFLQSRSSSEEKSGLVDIAYGDRHHDQPRDYKKTWLELAQGELTLYEYTGFGDTALSRGAIIERISLDHITSFRRPVSLGSLGANLSEFSLLISKPRSSNTRGDDSALLDVDIESAALLNQASSNSLTKSLSVESSPLSLSRSSRTQASQSNNTSPLNATAAELLETEFRNLTVRVPAGTGASDWFFSFVTAVVVNVSSKREAPVASALTNWLRSQNPGFDGLTTPTPVMTPTPTTIFSDADQQTTSVLMKNTKNALKFPPRATLMDDDDNDDDDDDSHDKVRSNESKDLRSTVNRHRTTGSSTSSSPSPTGQLVRKKSDDGLFFGDLSETKTVVTAPRPGLRTVKTFDSITPLSNTQMSSINTSSSTPKYVPPHLRRQLSLSSALDDLAEAPKAISSSKPFVRHSYSTVGIGQGHGVHGIFSSQGPRLRMEDAHIAIPDLQSEFENNQRLFSALNADYSDMEGRFGDALRFDAREFSRDSGRVAQSAIDLSVLTGSSLYAVFDGHGGVESSLYAQRHFVKLFCDRLRPLLASENFSSPVLSASSKEDKICEMVGKAITLAFSDIDAALLRFADEGTWKSGTTALVVVPRKGGRLIVASLGDSRAVLARPSHHHTGADNTCICKDNTDSPSKLGLSACMYSAEVISSEHTPEVERSRIVAAGGWVSIETEISLFKFHSMDTSDPFVSRRLRQGKTLESRISRLCGELGVSRSLGDADYKGKRLSSYTGWSWPIDRNVEDRFFSADLVLGSPDVNVISVEDSFDSSHSSEDDNVPFIILACDGLWEVLSNEEAVCICAQYLKEHGFMSTRELRAVDRSRGESSSPDSHVPVGAARRLAELALKLGTSDNLTVMIVLLA
jgi:serine/threonine protein phosphatase PrpC